ncbi:MAG: 3-dehydroquinate synthase II, partial [Crenarchaeota archaeon]|nr:3-dehydroquinate synthase II [Thermoproteota archaeon]
MKELWFQIKKESEEQEKLLKIAGQMADFIVEDKKATSTSGKGTVTILENFNSEKIRELKQIGEKIALRITIAGKQDENDAVKAADFSVDYILINCHDWRVIPLENLIAKIHGKSILLAEIENSQDAKLVLEALELGTDGVLLTTSSSEELSKTAAIIKLQAEKITFSVAKIVSTNPIGTGARACIDTCDLMTAGEGIIIGSQSAGLFLVEAEVHENPYVASRPFRVNAGSVSMYTLGSLE